MLEHNYVTLRHHSGNVGMMKQMHKLAKKKKKRSLVAQQIAEHPESLH